MATTKKKPTATTADIISNREMRRNILRVIRRDRRTANVERIWYRRAYKWARLISEVTGEQFELIASLAAILSPNVEWVDNRRIVIALLRDGNATHYRNRKGNYVRINGYGFNLRKARLLLASRDLTLCSGQKVTRFRDAILGIDACVVDVHATNVAMGTVNVYSGPSKNVYAHFEEAYRDAANFLGWRVCEVQSATWVIYKQTNRKGNK